MRPPLPLGTPFAALTVTGPASPHPITTEAQYACRCVCGRTRVVVASALASGAVKRCYECARAIRSASARATRARSCGRAAPEPAAPAFAAEPAAPARAAEPAPRASKTSEAPDPMRGRVFGTLTVGSRVATPAGRGGLWYRCRCACGAERLVLGSHLRTGHVTRCRACAVACMGELQRTAQATPQTYAHAGVRQTLSAWARSVGMDATTLIWRVRAGPPLAEALTRPVASRPASGRRGAS